MNIHKRPNKRHKFVCFIDKCQKSYLYICTLKKHLNYVHRNEFNAILKRYPRRNFFDVYKILLVDSSEFPFIEFKNDSSIVEKDRSEEERYLEGSLVEEETVYDQQQHVDLGIMPSATNVKEEMYKMNEMIVCLSKQLLTLQNTINSNMSQFVLLNDMYHKILMKQTDLIKLVGSNINSDVMNRYERGKFIFYSFS
jgi:hypothetical protein